MRDSPTEDWTKIIDVYEFQSGSSQRIDADCQPVVRVHQAEVLRGGGFQRPAEPICTDLRFISPRLVGLIHPKSPAFRAKPRAGTKQSLSVAAPPAPRTPLRVRAAARTFQSSRRLQHSDSARRHLTPSSHRLARLVSRVMEAVEDVWSGIAQPFSCPSGESRGADNRPVSAAAGIHSSMRCPCIVSLTTSSGSISAGTQARMAKPDSPIVISVIATAKHHIPRLDARALSTEAISVSSLHSICDASIPKARPALLSRLGRARD